MAKLGTAPTAPMTAPSSPVANPFPPAPQAPVAHAPTAPPQQAFPGMPGVPAAPVPHVQNDMQYHSSAPQPPVNQPAQVQQAYERPPQVAEQYQPQQVPIATTAFPLAVPQPGFANPQSWGAPPPAMQGGMGQFADAMLAAPGGAPGNDNDFMQIIGSVDLSQVASGGGKLLPMTDAAGNPIDYESIIVKAEFKRAQQTNNPMISLQLKVTYPISAAGVTLYDNVVLIDNSMWKYKDLLKACDLLSEDGKTALLTGTQDFVDNIVRHQITHQNDQQNVPRNRIAGSYDTAYQTPGLPPLTGAQAPQPAAAPNFGQR